MTHIYEYVNPVKICSDIIKLKIQYEHDSGINQFNLNCLTL